MEPSLSRSLSPRAILAFLTCFGSDAVTSSSMTARGRRRSTRVVACGSHLARRRIWTRARSAPHERSRSASLCPAAAKRSCSATSASPSVSREVIGSGARAWERGSRRWGAPHAAPLRAARQRHVLTQLCVDRFTVLRRVFVFFV